MPVRKLLIWPNCAFILFCVQLTLSMPLAAQEDCLTSADLSAIALTENSSYSEVSWKVTISNACDYPVEISAKWEIFDADDFLLDTDYVFGQFIAPNSSETLRSIALVSPADNAQKFVKQLFSVTSISRVSDDYVECLEVVENNSRVVEKNSTFTQIGWSAVVTNRCNSGVKAHSTNSVLEGNAHAIDEDRLYSRFFPANASKSIFGTHRVDSSLDDFIVSTITTFSDIEGASYPEEVEFGEWVRGSSSVLDMNTGVLNTIVTAGDGQFFSAGFYINSDLTFTFSQEVFASASEPPYRHSTYNSATGVLSFPYMEVQNYEGLKTLEHTEFNLVNADTLTFSVGTYADAANPNLTYTTDETGACLKVLDAGIRQLSRNNAYVEVSYKYEVENLCSDAIGFYSRFYFLGQTFVELDYDLMLDNQVEGMSRKTFSDTTLVGPVSFDSTAKLYVQLIPD